MTNRINPWQVAVTNEELQAAIDRLRGLDYRILEYNTGKSIFREIAWEFKEPKTEVKQKRESFDKIPEGWE